MCLDRTLLTVFTHLYHLCYNLLGYLQSSVDISPARLLPLAPLHVVVEDAHRLRDGAAHLAHLRAVTDLPGVQSRPCCLVLTQRPVYPVLRDDKGISKLHLIQLRLP